jgi:hypothetical protein|tara:strand:+ start:2585 stop:2821 length:237 start_codon:yes stop_codon:yes gene_type:complete
MDEKTLRDEIAMTVPLQAIPGPPSEEAMVKLCKSMGIDFDPKDVTKAIEASLQYQVAMRYKFADMMLEERKNGKDSSK